MGHKGNPQKQNNKTLYRQAGCCKFHVLVSLKKVNLNSTKLICWVAWVLKKGCLKLCTSNSHSSIHSGTVLVKCPNIKNTYQEIKEVIIFLEEKIKIWMPEIMSEFMPGRMLERMPDRMSERKNVGAYAR